MIISALRTVGSVAVFLVVFGAILSAVRSSDAGQEALKSEIVAEGECSLPGVIAHTSWYTPQEDRDREPICFLYVAPQSWHKTEHERYSFRDAPRCAINGFNFEGSVKAHEFVVARQWLIFPLRREEQTCVVTLDKRRWIEASKVDAKASALVWFATADKKDASFLQSGLLKEEITYFYLPDNLEEASVRSFAEQTVRNLRVRSQLYNRGSASYDYVHRIEAKLADYPLSHEALCTASGRGRSGDQYGKIECSREVISELRLRNEVRDGLTPKQRRDAYSALFYARMHAVPPPRYPRDKGYEDFAAALAAESDFKESRSLSQPREQEIARKLGLSERQVQMIKAEGRVLGRPGEMVNLHGRASLRH